MTNTDTATTLTTAQRVVRIVWPAFLAAGLMEILVFAFVDPVDLHWGSSALNVPPAGMYTLAFFAFWAITSLSSWLTVALSVPRAVLNPYSVK
jgi:hypothetical protein